MDWLWAGLWKIIILLVSTFYWLIGYLYEIFVVLIRTRIFTRENYLEIVDRIYLFLGIVVLFILAYNFLLLVIDPDKNKGGKVVEKFLKDFVICLALISFVPTIFDFAFDFEASIINNNVIQEIFTGVESDGSTDDIVKGGYKMAEGIFSSFFYQVDGDTGERLPITSTEDIKNKSKARGVDKNSITLSDLKESARNEGKYYRFAAFAKNIPKDEVEFDWFLALLAGGYVVYIMINYCFDMAVRVMKLAFFQIIAPIAIVCKMVPSKEGVFKNWYSKAIKIYLSSFIRIFILTLTIYIFSILSDNFVNGDFLSSSPNLSTGVIWIAYAMLILGIVTFMKQIPQLIDELFGLNADIKLGLRDKVRAAMPPRQALAAGALVGGAVTAGVRNTTHAWKKFGKDFKDIKAGIKSKNSKQVGEGFKNFAGHALLGAFSTMRGAAAAGFQGLWYGKDSKNFKDMFAASEKSARNATNVRDRRDLLIQEKGGGFKGTVAGLTEDIIGRPLKTGLAAVGTWMGLTAGSIQEQSQRYTGLIGSAKNFGDSTETFRDKNIKDADSKIVVGQAELIPGEKENITGASLARLNNYINQLENGGQITKKVDIEDEFNAPEHYVKIRKYIEDGGKVTLKCNGVEKTFDKEILEKDSKEFNDFIQKARTGNEVKLTKHEVVTLSEREKFEHIEEARSNLREAKELYNEQIQNLLYLGDENWNRLKKGTCDFAAALGMEAEAQKTLASKLKDDRTKFEHFRDIVRKSSDLSETSEGSVIAGRGDVTAEQMKNFKNMLSDRQDQINKRQGGQENKDK